MHACVGVLILFGRLEKSFFKFQQVQDIQEMSAKLQASYAGDKAREIQNREAEVVNAWMNLQLTVEGRKVKLVDTGDLFKFFSMVRDLMLWMDDIIRQMNTQVF